MARAWFTPESARRAVPRVEPLARRVCRCWRALRAVAPEPRPEGRVDAAYFREVCRFHAAARTLAREGLLFRDLADGWFEFPARRDGRDVRLAWRVGSPAPAGWSERGERNVVRQIDETGPWEEPGGSS